MYICICSSTISIENDLVDYQGLPHQVSVCILRAKCTIAIKSQSPGSLFSLAHPWACVLPRAKDTHSKYITMGETEGNNTGIKMAETKTANHKRTHTYSLTLHLSLPVKLNQIC